MKVVAVLADLAGQATPAESTWRGLWASARQEPGASKGAASNKGKKPHWLRIFASAVAAALIAGFFTPIGNNVREILWNFFSGDSRHTSQTTEELQASAAWCCGFTQVDASAGFYWPGAAARLDNVLNPTHNVVKKLSDLTPAGVGVIEIPMHTRGSDPIYVAPPKVFIRSRKQNYKNGMIAVLPVGGQGTNAPAQFEADVDAAAPVTTPYKSRGSQYYYVSNTSPEILILIVTDDRCDCTFDIQLVWQANGYRHSTLLTNNGKHFHIIGSSGLPWYGGDPMVNQKLARIEGHPFSSYAPG